MTRGTLSRAVAALALGLAAHAAAAPPSAKELFFDRKYAEARTAWEAVKARGGADAAHAQYWIARSSESLGEHERALAEYGAYLAQKPADRALAEEARVSRVGIAARLHKQGRTAHAGVLQEALGDPSRTVRYFAALQAASLGGDLAARAVPVLTQIVAKETDEDLVQRAQLALLKADPKALGRTARPSAAPGRAARTPSFIRVRIVEKGQTKPTVQITLPLGLAELVFKSLPEDAVGELKAKGFQPDTFWERLKALGPAEIIDIEGEDGEKVQIWTE
jgi:hypothetical protein